MTVDILAGEPHFLDHLAPVWHALPPDQRGAFLVIDGLAKRARRVGIETRSFDDEPTRGPILVASWGDLRRAMRRGWSRLAFLEHGAGQSYGGDPESAAHSSFAGGKGRDAVSLTFAPNRSCGDRWRQAYPAMDVRVIGCPKLDGLPRREPGPGPVVALSFHFNHNIGCPEGNSAFHHFRAAIPALAASYALIGHAHPRHADRIQPWFERAGVPFVADFADVCRRADLYVADNSSTLFEFAATGRPVVVLNVPEYRRNVEHGLRFWEAATVGVQFDGPPARSPWAPAQHRRLAAAIDLALADPPEQQQAREAALRIAYAYRHGAAKRAAAALVEWAATAEPVAA